MNSVNPIDLAERAQRRAADPLASVWVSASAGSGKTKVLTDRVLALLLAGTLPERILCLTFTKAAAAEMNNRITQRLAFWVTAEDSVLDVQLAELLVKDVGTNARKRARRLFTQVLDAPGGLRISTIHAFCQSVLRRFPLEAGVPPHFAVMDERDAAESLMAAQESTIAHASAGGDPGLAEALSAITARVHETMFAELMGEVSKNHGKLARLFDHYGGLDHTVAALRRRLGLSAQETEDTIIAAACRDDAFAVGAVKRIVVVLGQGSKTDVERGYIIAAWLADPLARAASFARYSEAYLTSGEIRARLATKTVLSLAADADDVLRAEAQRLQDVLARVRAARVTAGTEALLRLGAHLLARYSADKARRGLMDYDDLIQATRRLLARTGTDWVLYKLDGGLDHILIDEGQDTNPDQWAIVDMIQQEFFAGQGRHEESAPRPRTVFAVGDRKQSIFSFQGASPEEFERVREHTATRVRDAGLPWQDVALNVSFRSTPAVLEAVDAVFSQPGARDGVALGDEDIAHLASREGTGGAVEIWPLVEPAPSDALPTWKPPVERTSGDSPPHRLAALLAKRIAKMVDEKEVLESRGRPIRPGDIMVLVRRRTGFVEELVRQLKNRGIAVAGVDRMMLTEQIAVMDLVALGQFLLLPEDDLTLAIVLKSPLVGLTEEELFILAHGREGRGLWDVLSAHAGSGSRFGAAHKFLAALLAKTDYLTPADLYGEVLVAWDGRRKLLGRLGLDADDPIDEFMELALGYQRRHPPSLQGFLHWLAAGETEIKRDLEQGGGDSLRIITVHGAKGLQAPIVFLPDTAQVPQPRDKLLWSGDDMPLPLWAPTVGDLDTVARAAREAAAAGQAREYRRLLYVAMTRAEDRLYVCGWNTRKPRDADASWYAMVRRGLASSPRTASVTDPFLAAEGTLPSGDILRLTSPQEKPPGKREAVSAPKAAAEIPAWARRDPPPEATPPKPLAPSRITATEGPVLSPLSGDGRVRFQRGRLIHRLLQSLPDLPPERRREAAAAFVARPAWGLDPNTQSALVNETLAVLDAPAFNPLFAGGSRAEVPITGLIGAFAVAGQVDRLAVTTTEVWVIDYKTNRPPAEKAADVDRAYVFQMATYRAALQTIYPRHRIRCVLLWTDGPFMLELEDAQMDSVLRHTGLIS